MNESQIIMVILGITALITYPFASVLIRDYAKSFKKGCVIRKLLVILSIIPFINIIILFGMMLKIIFEVGKELLVELIKDFKEEFKDEL